MEGIENLLAVPVNIAVLAADGMIIHVNQSWREFGCQNGLASSEHGIGDNYLELCRRELGPVHRLTKELQALLEGRSALLTWAYPCHSPDRKRWFNLIGVPRARGEPGALLLHIDITSFVQSGGPENGPVPETSWSALMPQVHDLQSWDAISQASVKLRTRRGELTQTGSTLAPKADPFSALPEWNALTPRQREVLALLSQGKTNAQIAEMLGVSLNTIRVHVSAILKRLNLVSRTQAAVFRITKE